MFRHYLEALDWCYFALQPFGARNSSCDPTPWVAYMAKPNHSICLAEPLIAKVFSFLDLGWD